MVKNIETPESQELWAINEARNDLNDLRRELDDWIPEISKFEFDYLCERGELTDDELKQIIKFYQNEGFRQDNPDEEFHQDNDLYLQSITDKQIELLLNIDNIKLNLKLKKITTSQATKLSKFKNLRISLDETTDEQIKQLNKEWNNPFITLYNVTESQSNLTKNLWLKTSKLTSNQARAIEWRDTILIDWLKEMEWEWIHSKPWQHICLIWIEKITDLQAKNLSKADYLSLSGIKEITDEQAKSLWNIRELFLMEIKSLTDEQAKYLSNCESLNMRWLKSLTDKQFKYLMKVKHLNINENILTPTQKMLFNIKEKLRLSKL